VAWFNEAARERRARGVVANIPQSPPRQVKSGQIEELPSGGGQRAGAWNRGIPSRRTSCVPVRQSPNGVRKQSAERMVPAVDSDGRDPRQSEQVAKQVAAVSFGDASTRASKLRSRLRRRPWAVREPERASCEAGCERRIFSGGCCGSRLWRDQHQRAPATSSQSSIGILTASCRAHCFASSQPASACRKTPIIGSFVRMRSMRADHGRFAGLPHSGQRS
jgi:hypothetical protein